MKTFAVAMLAAVGSGLGLSSVIDRHPAVAETVAASNDHRHTQIRVRGDSDDWARYAGSELGHAVERIVRESAWALEGLQGTVEIEEWDGGMAINVADAIDVSLDLDALEALIETVGEDVSRQMETLADELSEQYERFADEVERRYRESRRHHR